MAFDPDAFRAAFPAFGDMEAFSSPEITFWGQLGLSLHNADRYGDLLTPALYLFVAHNLSVEANSKASAASGQAQGGIVGAITSASVDKVSYSRDAGSAMDPKNGHWNLSSYGLRWVQLQRLVGAGGLQIGVGGGTPNVSASAWPGPNLGFW